VTGALGGLTGGSSGGSNGGGPVTGLQCMWFSLRFVNSEVCGLGLMVMYLGTGVLTSDNWDGCHGEPVCCDGSGDDGRQNVGFGFFFFLTSWLIFLCRSLNYGWVSNSMNVTRSRFSATQHRQGDGEVRWITEDRIARVVSYDGTSEV